MEFHLIERLDTDTGISWWDANRRRLNDVIHKFNEWQTVHRFDDWERQVVKAYIELCERAGEDLDFSDWQFELLTEMKQFLEKHEASE